MASESRRLRRLPGDGQLTGVCAGLAEYFNIDVTLVRVVFVLLAFMTGGGFIIGYIVLAVVMPSEDGDSATGGDVSKNIQELETEFRNTERGDRLRNIFGLGLILLGAFLLLRLWFPGWFMFRWDYLWPVMLILIGVFIATRKRG